MSLRAGVLTFAAFFLIFAINLTLVTVHYHNNRVAEKRIAFLEELENPNNGEKLPLSAPPLVLGTVESEIVVDDGRAANLRNFFRKYNSPLYDYADYIIQVSDKYNFDYRLLPAIAMQESTGCQKIPPGSYNCWGYGIYGDNVIMFDSYEHALDTVAAGLKKNYVDQGLITPQDVMAKYTPSSNGSWANAIVYFFGVLD